MGSYNKSKFFILCILSLLATYFTTIGSQFKVLPIVCIYIPLCGYYKKYGSLLKLKGWSKIIFCSYVFYCIFLILRSVFYDSNSGVRGDYVLSLFGNLEFGILPWVLPIIFFVVYEQGILLSYKNVCDMLVTLGILLGLLYLGNIDSSSFNKIFYLVPVVCPRLLLCKQRQYLYWGYFAISFIYCYVEDERSILGMNLLCIAGLLVFILFKDKKKIIDLVIIYSSIVPIVGISLSTINLVTGDSIFTILEDKYGSKSDMTKDTRTFLFRELNEDLTRTSSWTYGKGIFGTYYSEVMHNNALNGVAEGDNEYRLGSESGYLWLLLKGGIIYSILYVLLFYTAIMLGNKSGNYYLQFLSFILANRLLLMFVSFTPTFDVSNILIWLFLALIYQQVNYQYNVGRGE